MRKPQEVTVSAPGGYHFTGETEAEIQIVAVDIHVSDGDIQHIEAMLGLVFYKLGEQMELPAECKRSFISLIFKKTARYDLLKEFI